MNMEMCRWGMSHISGLEYVSTLTPSKLFALRTGTILRVLGISANYECAIDMCLIDGNCLHYVRNLGKWRVERFQEIDSPFIWQVSAQKMIHGDWTVWSWPSHAVYWYHFAPVFARFVCVWGSFHQNMGLGCQKDQACVLLTRGVLSAKYGILQDPCLQPTFEMAPSVCECHTVYHYSPPVLSFKRRSHKQLSACPTHGHLI